MINNNNVITISSLFNENVKKVGLNNIEHAKENINLNEIQDIQDHFIHELYNTIVTMNIREFISYLNNFCDDLCDNILYKPS